MPGGYIFPPLLAEILRPLAAIPELLAARIWLGVSHTLLLITIVVLWRALRNLVTPTTGLTLLAAGLLFLPLYESLAFQQVGVLLLLLITLAAGHLRARPRDEATAGVWLGLATVLRVTPLLLAPAMAWVEPRAGKRGRSLRAYGLLAMSVTVIVLLALLAQLTASTITYFTDVLPRIGGGTDIFENQSLPAVSRGFEIYGGAALPDPRGRDGHCAVRHGIVAAVAARS